MVYHEPDVDTYPVCSDTEVPELLQFPHPDPSSKLVGLAEEEPRISVTIIGLLPLTDV